MASATRKKIPPAKPPARVQPTADGTPEPFPARIEPMNAQVRAEPFNDPDWTYEPKLDGYRATAYIHDGTVRILSRGGVDYTPYFPDIIRALAAQPIKEMVLDAELVAFDDGRPSFEALQRRVNKRSAALRKDPAQCVLFCFDVLHLAGMSTRDLPYTARRRLLLESVAPSECVQVILADDDGKAMYAAALATGLEGMVGKRKDSLYRPGVRSPDWLKIKPSKTAKFLVVGYLQNRTGLTSLLLGYWQEGKVIYAGRVGSGLTMKLCDQLHAALDQLPPGATLAKRAGAVWVEPRIVIEVAYFDRWPVWRHPMGINERSGQRSRWA